MADEKQNMGWMYEGPKSLVNREDYLLGKMVSLIFFPNSLIFSKF
jgi:hypothetical protein